VSKARSAARRLAVQALYQWQVTGEQIGSLVNGFLADPEHQGYETAYFRDLVGGVVEHLGELDSALEGCLDRGVERVDLVERAILRLGAYEFAHHPEIPYRVVINEAVELAKVFGAEQGHRYVNGVLDRLARSLRATETQQRGG